MSGLNSIFKKAHLVSSVKDTADRYDRLKHNSGTKFDAPVSPGGKFKAQFDITITRNTSNIAQNLDIAILGFTEVLSSYSGFVAPTVGGTVALTGGTYNALPDRYRFTHVNGANTDTIDVTSSTNPYPSLLQNSALDSYRINNIRMTVSDTTLADQQFNNRFVFTKRSIFGLATENPISVASFKDPMNNQNNIVDIPIDMSFDKETCIVMAMANEAVAATAYEVTLSFFVEFYKKLGAGGDLRK